MEYKKIDLGERASSIMFDGELIVSHTSFSSGFANISASITGGKPKKARMSLGDKISLKNDSVIYEVVYSSSSWLFKNFAEFIVCKIEVSEIWKEAVSEGIKKPFEIEGINSDDPFSDEEKEDIRRTLSELQKSVLKEFGKQKEQSKVIKDNIDYMVGLLNRQRKKDWLHTSIGVFATLAASLCLTGEQAATFWQFIRDYIGEPVRNLLGRGSS